LWATLPHSWHDIATNCCGDEQLDNALKGLPSRRTNAAFMLAVFEACHRAMCFYSVDCPCSHDRMSMFEDPETHMVHLSQTVCGESPSIILAAFASTRAALDAFASFRAVSSSSANASVDSSAAANEGFHFFMGVGSSAACQEMGAWCQAWAQAIHLDGTGEGNHILHDMWCDESFPIHKLHDEFTRFQEGHALAYSAQEDGKENRT
jgi:hypothetical protein